MKGKKKLKMQYSFDKTRNRLDELKKNRTPYEIGVDAGIGSDGVTLTAKNGFSVFLSLSRIFDVAKTALVTRTGRGGRRNRGREKHRIKELIKIMKNEILKIDEHFFDRLKKSSFTQDDREESLRGFTVINDSEYTDSKLHEEYPTIFHLMKDLIQNPDYHDPRLVFMAIKYCLEHRGHFNLAGELSDNADPSVLFDKLNDVMSNFDSEFCPKNDEALIDVLCDENLPKKDKVTKATEVYGEKPVDTSTIKATNVIALLSGSSVKISSIFIISKNEQNETTKKSICLASDLDEIWDELSACLNDDQLNLIEVLKEIYDNVILRNIMGDEEYFSFAKVNRYEEYKKELRKFKSFVKKYFLSIYNRTFYDQRNCSGGDKFKNNYAAYAGYRKNGSAKYSDFLDFVKSNFVTPCMDDEKKGTKAKVVITDPDDIAYLNWLKTAIENETFLKKPRSTDNSSIPMQIMVRDLKAILDNARKYTDGLNEIDPETGLCGADRILAEFNFRIPYYVGPINSNSKHAWAVARSDEKINATNLTDVIDLEKTSEAFMNNLVGKCKYTGEQVLPAQSIIYSKFAILNVLNAMKINGMPVSVDVKKDVFNHFFVERCANTTEKKAIADYLVKKGVMTKTDSLTGISDKINLSMRSYNDFKYLLERTGDLEMVETIIKWILVYPNDSYGILEKKLSVYKDILTKDDIKFICSRKYKGWGKFSKTFLTDIFDKDGDENTNIISMMYDNNLTLSSLMANNYTFAEKAETIFRNNLGHPVSIAEHIDAMSNSSPQVKRGLTQFFKIYQDIVDYMGYLPEKVYVETTRSREDSDEPKSRYDDLKGKYEKAKLNKDPQYQYLYDELTGHETKESLRNNAVYLYYSQLGRDMYTGKVINRYDLDNGSRYDKDHIIYRALSRDDSVHNNLCLTTREKNGSKGDKYPINRWDEHIQESMKPFWGKLRNSGLITDEKYSRLIRTQDITDADRKAFSNGDITKTSQICTSIARILSTYQYIDRNGEVLNPPKVSYVKANDISEFRKKFGIIKNRSLNNLHHAVDAYLAIIVGRIVDADKNQNIGTVFDRRVSNVWIPEDKVNVEKGEIPTIDIVRRNLEEMQVISIRQPHEQTGKYYNETIVPSPKTIHNSKPSMPTKNDRPVEKYGGYTNRYAAYFCIVESEKKKGERVREFQPVYIYAKKLYESNPIKYCKDELNLKNPKIVYKKILVDQLLCIDGVYMYITGFTQNRITVEIANELDLADEYKRYIKTLESQARFSKNASANPKITGEKNVRLFDEFCRELCDGPYRAYYNFGFKSVIDLFSKSETRTYFENMETNKQVSTLLEFIKLFTSNPEKPSFAHELLGTDVSKKEEENNQEEDKQPASKCMGSTRAAASIANTKEVKIIHSSPAGIYQHIVTV